MSVCCDGNKYIYIYIYTRKIQLCAMRLGYDGSIYMYILCMYEYTYVAFKHIGFGAYTQTYIHMHSTKKFVELIDNASQYIHMYNYNGCE